MRWYADHLQTRGSLWVAIAAVLFLGLASVSSAQQRAVGDSWPTYLGDMGRSGISADGVEVPLDRHWQYRPPGEPTYAFANPQPIPVEGILEAPRLRYDDAYHVAIDGGLVFLGSSADGIVYALDAATGLVRWRFFTNGPVRMAPTVSDGKVYVGSDDGHVYCLTAADGSLVWDFRAGPTEERILGGGRMVSMWPVRTGVVVDGGVAYFAGGIFPAERIYLYAVDANLGTVIWSNNTLSDQNAGQNGFSPQGYMLASSSSLFVTSGRALPARFAREDGRFIYQPGGNWRADGVLGGTYALIAGDHLYSGSGTQVVTLDQEKGSKGFAWFPGKRLVVTEQVSYMLSEAGITALDRQAYPAASNRRREVAKKREALMALKPRPEDFDERLKTVEAEELEAERLLETCTLFDYDREDLHCMIVAGEQVLAGGDEQIVCLDGRSGQCLWEEQVDGVVRGLAVASGRLYVSCEDGTTYCFGSGPAPAPAPAPETAAFADDDTGKLCADAAEAILAQTGIRRGYCLVLGNGTGRLARELAGRSELLIYAVDDDRAAVMAARDRLNAEKAYGHRVIVEHADLAAVPYSDYFANLIVSEDAVVSGTLPPSADEALRMLKPCGGAVCLGQPAGAANELDPAAVRQWLAAAGMADARTDGAWTTYVRPALEGAGSWTHQYGTPGNIASSEDTALTFPLGVLWYGDPGPDKVPSRHARNAAPLSLNGRVYLQGTNLIMCFDAYNGLPYWEREIDGASRLYVSHNCSNLACREDSLFVAAKDKCFRLDAETGETLAEYSLPDPGDEVKRTWAYVAVVGDRLFGSSSAKNQWTDSIFAIDIDSGRQQWLHKGEQIWNNSIAIDDGRLMLAESTITQEHRAEALADRVQALVTEKGIDEAAALKELEKVDVRLVCALSIETGELLWQRPVDLTDCTGIGPGGGTLQTMVHNGAVVLAANHGDGHYWNDFLGKAFEKRRAVVLSDKDGSLLWTRAIGCRIRPLIVGDTLYAEPWAFDLQTGEPRTRVHPLTGRETIWEMERPGHHCGAITGSPNGLFFRSWSSAHYDLLADQGAEHFGGQRAGCWMNQIPANGLLIEPEASSGCVCLHSIQCTVVFKPREQHKGWGLFASRGEMLPVKRIGLSLGAPGDRRDPQGNLWLGYPRPWGRMRLDPQVQVAALPKCGYYAEPAETCKVTGTDSPWLYASGMEGMNTCRIPLIGDGDGPALYTVRLGFAPREGDKPGQRVFDVKIQGQTVATELDIAAETGGDRRAVVKQFSAIACEDMLSIQLVPKVGDFTPSQTPALSTVEVVREQVLAVGLTGGRFEINDLYPTQTLQIALANRTEKPFRGTLSLTAPDTLTATVDKPEVELQPDQKTTVVVTLQVKTKGEPATGQVDLRLLRTDGNVEAEKALPFEYLGTRGRLVVKSSFDTYVGHGSPSTDYSGNAALLVDGGGAAMGDESHNIAYLSFPLDIPGRPLSAKLRIHTANTAAAESNNSGTIHLVEAEWDNAALRYTDRPAPGRQVGVLGKVGNDTLEERVLDVDLSGMTELRLVLEPTSTDGASYFAAETGKGPELVIEYETAP